MNEEELNYLRRRERQERAAAKNAGTLATRRAHQELADSYATLLHRLIATDPTPALRNCGAI